MSKKRARQRVGSPMQEASKHESKSMTNMMLPKDLEGESMTQHEKKAREHKQVANKMNRSASRRVDSPIQEASKEAREHSKHDNSEREAMT